MQLDKHPILWRIHDLCLEFEQFPASEDQTALVLKIGLLGEEIEAYIDKHNLRSARPPHISAGGSRVGH